MVKYNLTHPFRKDIFNQTYRNVVYREYNLTLALYCTYASLDTCGVKFKKLIIVRNISNLLNSFVKQIFSRVKMLWII